MRTDGHVWADGFFSAMIFGDVGPPVAKGSPPGP